MSTGVPRSNSSLATYNYAHKSSHFEWPISTSDAIQLESSLALTHLDVSIFAGQVQRCEALLGERRLLGVVIEQNRRHLFLTLLKMSSSDE